MAKDTVPDKICAACGRPFSWRKKWERNWDEVRYCSSSCRGKKRTQSDEELESLVLEMATTRAPKSLCPSEVARRYEENRTGASDESWRQWMEPVRTAVRLLAAAGKVQVLQSHRVVDAGTMRGPIRIRIAPAHQ